MACCDHDDHDYCCRCYTERERSRNIILDVIRGEYDGEVDIPKFELPITDSRAFAEAIVAVLKHENLV